MDHDGNMPPTKTQSPTTCYEKPSPCETWHMHGKGAQDNSPGTEGYGITTHLRGKGRKSKPK